MEGTIWTPKKHGGIVMNNFSQLLMLVTTISTWELFKDV